MAVAAAAGELVLSLPNEEDVPGALVAVADDSEEETRDLPKTNAPPNERIHADETPINFPFIIVVA